MGQPRTTTAEVIGNYRIEEQIGRGGMGIVFRGRHLNLPREVAIKVVKAQSGDDLRHQRTRFEREAFIQSQLDHPGIVKVYDYIVGEANYYIVMEYVSGLSLAELLARHPRGLPAARALDIFQQILAAVSYAHTFTYKDEEAAPHTGIIHRDLKPANILVTPEDHTKITDFGIVKLVGADDTRTFSRPYGTPQYVSPEQAEGSELDQRSDIYSLGVILYEMLTGIPPFGGRANQREIDGESGAAGVGTPADQPLRRSEILRAHISRPPRPPIELNPEICFDLNETVLCALSKNPSERFKSAIDFARAIRRAAISGSHISSNSANEENHASGSVASGSIHKSSGSIHNSASNRDASAGVAGSESSASFASAAAGDTDNNVALNDTERISYVTQPIGGLMCDACGAESEPGDRACRACGSDLQLSPATKMLAEQSSSAWRHLPGWSNGGSKLSVFLRPLPLLLIALAASISAYGIYRGLSRAVPVETHNNISVDARNASTQLTPSLSTTQPADIEIVKIAPQEVSVDSSYAGYNAQPLTDGIVEIERIRRMRYNLGNWASAESPAAHWVEFKFAAPIRLATVYIYWGFDRDRFVASNQVELQTYTEESGEWRTIARITPGDDYDRTAFDFPAQTVNRLRVVQPARMGPRNRPFVMWMREIEAFAFKASRE